VDQAPRIRRAGGQEITMTLHVSTHLDAPAHFMTRGKFSVT